MCVCVCVCVSVCVFIIMHVSANVHPTAIFELFCMLFVAQPSLECLLYCVLHGRKQCMKVCGYTGV